jgi:hypothetical protein
MKRLLILLGCVLGAAACSSPIAPSSAAASAGTSLDANLTADVTPSTFILNSRPQTFTGEVAADPEVDWVLTSDVPWMVVETTRGRGTARFMARVDLNLCTSLTRVGHIQIAPGGGVVTVQQDGSDVGVCP